MLLQSSILLQAQSPDSIWQRSQEKFKQQDYHGVVEDMNMLLRNNSAYANAFYNRGIARLNLGDLENACNDLQIAQSKGADENTTVHRISLQSGDDQGFAD